MIIPIEPREPKGGDGSSAVAGPEKGFLVVGGVRHPSPSRDAVLQARARTHRDPVPHGAALEAGARVDTGVSEYAVESVAPRRGSKGESAPALVERAGSSRERSSPLERFERRAQKIARAAEVGVIAGVEHVADLLPALGEEGLPQVGDERGLARGNPPEQTRGEDADARVQEGPSVAGPEARDAVPFGLKRRVPVGVSVFSHQQSRRPAGAAMAGKEAGVIWGDRGVRVDDEKIAIAARQESRCVAQGSRRTEQDRLAEKRELWRSRRLLAQAALDLIAQVMEIHRHLADAGLLKPLEVRGRDGDVEKG